MLWKPKPQEPGGSLINLAKSIDDSTGDCQTNLNISGGHLNILRIIQEFSVSQKSQIGKCPAYEMKNPRKTGGIG